MSTLTAQAEKILAHAKQLDAYILLNNLPSPSFHQDSLNHLPPEHEAVRCAIIDATHTLKRLAQGTVGATAEMLYCFTDVTTLRAIYHYKIPQAVPLTGSITYDEIAQQVSLPVKRVSHFLRHAMASQIFTESLAGQVAHTAISRALSTDPEFFEAVGLVTDEFAPASNALIGATDTYPNSQEPTHTGYNLANKTPLPIYEFLLQHPQRMRRFATGMRFFTRGEGWDLKYLRAGHDWDAIDRPSCIVVDVGGGQGAVSQYLASSTRYLRFVIQDSAAVTNSGEATLPEDLKERIDFMPHDFFTEQPVKGADVYFMRWVLHNWSDKYCLQILRNLAPALKKGSRVMLYESLLPEKPITELTQKGVLNLDMVVLSCFNSSERTIMDWQRLFELADKRFHLENVVTPEGSTMSIIKAMWL